MSGEVWVPVPLRWRHVIEGDVFVSPDGDIWMVTLRGEALTSVTSGQIVHVAEVDPDDTVDVLVPATEREAVELCIEELGARLIERRSA